LGAAAFETAVVELRTFRDVLQDPQIPTVFFDVRNDSDTLYAHFNVALQEVEDVQPTDALTVYEEAEDPLSRYTKMMSCMMVTSKRL
jgi:predicted sulfurtransferase